MPVLLRLRFPKQLVFCAIEYLVPLGPALPRDVLFFSSPAASLIKPYLFAQDPTSGTFLTRKRGPPQAHACWDGESVTGNLSLPLGQLS